MRLRLTPLFFAAVLLSPAWTTQAQSPDELIRSALAAEDRALFASGQVWSGKYVCGQGKTDLVLRITDVEGPLVTGVFEFAVSAELTGRFHIQGEYQPSKRRIAFRPGDWISQPSGYTTVGLLGHVDRGGSVIAGVIDGRGCSTFAVTKFSD